MSYNPTENYDSELRNPSGIVFFGKDPSRPMLDSSSNFLIDEDSSTLKVPNIVISNNGKIGSVGSSGILNLASDGTATFSNDVVVNGNLSVEGDVLTVNTQTLLVEDNVITLNSGNFASPTEDAGIEVFRGTGGSPLVTLKWDEGSDHWMFTNDGTNFDNIVGATGAETLTNKDIDASENNIYNIPNSGLINSSVTVAAGTGLTGGGTVNLGNTITINLAAGNGLVSSDDLVSAKAGSGIAVDANGIHVVDSVISSRAFLASTGVAPDQDTLLIYDSGTGLRQITVNDLINGADLLTEFSVSGLSTSDTSTLSEGEKLVFAGGTSNAIGIVPVISTDAGGNPVVTLNVDNSLIQGRSEANFNEDDLLLFYDSDGAGLRSVTQQQFISDVIDAVSGVPGSGGDPGIMTYWALHDGQAGDDHISLIYNLTTLTMTGVSGVNVNVNGPYDQVKVGLEPTAVTTGTYGDANSVGSFTVDQNGRITGASNVDIEITASQVSDFDAEAQDAVFLNANFLDTATIDFTVNETTHAVSGKVIDGSITEAHINSSALLSTGGLQGGSSTKLSVKAGNAITVNSTGVSVTDDGITNAKLRNSSALSVIGRSANSIGDPADIVAGTDHYVLRRSGSSLGFGLIGTNNISDDAITEAKLFRAIQTATSTVTATGDIILAEGGTGGITINLPAITSNEGRIITIKKTDAAVGQIIIDGNSTETIDGAQTKRLYYQYETMTLVCDASAGWYII